MTRLGLYAGGFLGPFGGGVIVVLIPELRDAFDASTSAVSLGITAYMVPFAVFQLVSGTLGERLGLVRTVRVAYVLYAIASVAAAFSPGIGLFLGCRALQGAANAFLTPLLLAALTETAPPGAIGRTVGSFVAVQTTALVASPLLGGLVGEISWRLAFLLPAAVAAALACVPLIEGARDAHATPPRLRSALTRRVGALSAASFLSYMCTAGLGFLVALRAADAFGLGATERGALVAGFGVAGILAGRPAGDLADRRGRVPAVLAGAAICALAIPALGVAGSVGWLAFAWAVAGAGTALVWAGVNTMAVEAVPGNRAGTISIISAFRFAGNAIAPILWLPLYEARVSSAFLVAGAGSVAMGAIVFGLRQG
jgi:MFS family permease